MSNPGDTNKRLLALRDAQSLWFPPQALLEYTLKAAEIGAEEAKAEAHERYVAGVRTGEVMRSGLMTKITELRRLLDEAIPELESLAPEHYLIARIRKALR